MEINEACASEHCVIFNKDVRSGLIAVTEHSVRETVEGLAKIKGAIVNCIGFRPIFETQEQADAFDKVLRK